MREPISRKMAQAIREVETALIEGAYRELGSESRPSRLSASEIQMALGKYAGRVTRAPDKALEETPAIRVSRADPPEWRVDFDLWIGGKRSDLTLSLTLSRIEQGKYIALIDDLHIL